MKARTVAHQHAVNPNAKSVAPRNAQAVGGVARGRRDGVRPAPAQAFIRPYEPPKPKPKKKAPAAKKKSEES